MGIKQFFIILLLLIPNFALAQTQEVIESFKAEYNLKKSGIIEVSEEIKYDFGPNHRHGIYRYIPYKYQMTDGGTEYLNISKIKVEDENGKGYQVEKSTENGNIILKIGDPERTVSGLKTYNISYLVKGGFRYVDTDEFYWNVTGNGWNVPIQRVSAEVILEEPIETAKTKIDCFVGIIGSKEKCTNLENTFTENQNFTWGARYYQEGLLAGEGLTIVFNAPKGTFPVVTAGFLGSGFSQKVINFLITIAILIPIFTFFFMLRHFWKWGKDPKGRGAIVVEYEPPQALSPIEMGTILDFRVNTKDISAEIIYLATKGFLKIRKEEKKGILKKDDYTLLKVKEFKGNNFDFLLFDGLFGKNKEVKISELKENFYQTVQTVKSSVQGELVKKGYFKEKASRVIGKYLGFGGGLSALGFLILVTSDTTSITVLGTIFGPALLVSGVIICLFGIFMPARTKEGVEIKEKTLGFKRYLSMVEGRQIKWADDPKRHPEKFSEYLPYAMVFGVEKQWAKKFEGVIKENPDWYNDPSGRIFAPVYFASSVNNFTVATTQTMSAPSSSGGGGFSGGGFGGGGGGSW